jgi:hypothetical protein
MKFNAKYTKLMRLKDQEHSHTNYKLQDKAYNALRRIKSDVLRKEKEKIFSKDPNLSSSYAHVYLKSRFVLGEPAIYQSYYYEEYHRKFFKDERNPDFEKFTIDFIKNAYPYKISKEIISINEDLLDNIRFYCTYVLKSNWAELEAAIESVIDRFDNLLDYFVVDYCKSIKKERWLNVEKSLLNNFFNMKNTTFYRHEDYPISNYIEEFIEDWPEFENELENKLKSLPISDDKSSIIFGAGCAYFEKSNKHRWQILEDMVEVDENFGCLDCDDYEAAKSKKIKKLLKEKDARVLEYQNEKNFLQTIVNFARNNDISEEVRNYMIAKSIVSDKEAATVRKFLNSENNFKNKVKKFLSEFDENLTLRELVETI